MADTNHFLLRIPFLFHLFPGIHGSINQEKNDWIPKTVWLISKIRFIQLIEITGQTFSELRALKTEFMTLSKNFLYCFSSFGESTSIRQLGLARAPFSCPQERHSKRKKKVLYFSETPFPPNILLFLIFYDLLVLTSLGECLSAWINQPLMSHHPLKASVATQNLNNSLECLFPNIFCVPLKRLTKKNQTCFTSGFFSSKLISI